MIHMARLYNCPLQVIEYDLHDYDLRPYVRDALKLPEGFDLARLHEVYPLEYAAITRDNDSRTNVHKTYYERIANTGFYDMYRRIVHDLIHPLFDDEIAIQKVPSLRVHRPGGKAVGEAHRDSDSGFNHQPGAINFWWPLTNAFDTNTLWVDASGGEHSLQPVNVSLGHVLVFDAISLHHGNYPNATKATRLSIDFRVIPMNDYIESDKKSANTGTQLAIGGYYDAT